MPIISMAGTHSGRSRSEADELVLKLAKQAAEDTKTITRIQTYSVTYGHAVEVHVAPVRSWWERIFGVNIR